MKKYYHVITEQNDEYVSTVAIAENIETVKAHFAGQNVREIIELNAAQVNTISAATATAIMFAIFTFLSLLNQFVYRIFNLFSDASRLSFAVENDAQVFMRVPHALSKFFNRQTMNMKFSNNIPRPLWTQIFSPLSLCKYLNKD